MHKKIENFSLIFPVMKLINYQNGKTTLLINHKFLKIKLDNDKAFKSPILTSTIYEIHKLAKDKYGITDTFQDTYDGIKYSGSFIIIDDT